MIILDSTVVNVAFQTLRREFGAALTSAQWVISLYLLALGITTPLSGFLGDRFGIKRIYILGLTFFVVGSLLCGLAPTLLLLIIARAIQGIGGGMAQPLGPALLYRAFPPKEQGTALGFFGIALVVAPALGPMLNLRLFQNRTFLNATVVGYVTVLALFGAEFLMPVYLQALRGRTALQTGLILLALAVTAGIAMPVSGRIYDKVGPRPLVIV